jgi:flagellar hook-basal body complex protein FliE
MESWATELTRAIDEIEHKLKEAEKKYSKDNKQVDQTYNEAMDAVVKARTAISRFVGTFDRDMTT